MLCPHFENKVNCLVDILSILDKSKKNKKKLNNIASIGG